MLIKNGADLNAQNTNGDTPLTLEINQGNLKVNDIFGNVLISIA